MFRTKSERAERKARLMQFDSKEDRFSYEYEQIKKQVDKANNRLRAMSKKDIRSLSSTRKLVSRLSSDNIRAIERGRVIVTPYMEEAQLIAISKAVNDFLIDKSSTKSGRKALRNTLRANIKRTLSVDTELSDKEVDFISNLTNDSNFQYFTRELGVPPSTVWKLVESYKEEVSKATETIKEKYINRLVEMAEKSNDEEAQMRAKSLLDKIK